MKIKWKFEEESEEFDEHGNLKPYYKDSEPWKKAEPKNKAANIFFQILVIVLALIICGLVVVIGFSLGGYDWNQAPGIQILRDVIVPRLR